MGVKALGRHIQRPDQGRHHASGIYPGPGSLYTEEVRFGTKHRRTISDDTQLLDFDSYLALGD